MSPLRVALLTTDSREHYKEYSRPQPFFGSAPDALIRGFAAVPEVEVHVISCLQQPTNSPPKLFDNVYYHALHVPKLGWLRTGFLGCTRAVRRRLRELSPALVHGQGTERDCALNAVRSGRPNLVTVHGNMRRVAAVTGAKAFSYGWVMALLEKRTLPRTGGVICITHHTRKEVEGLARRTWVVPNAVDPSFFDLPRQPQARPLIFCVAHIYNLKNQNHLIRALDPLAAETTFTLRFLGAVQETDPYGREFLELVKQRPWCEYAGRVNSETLKTELTRATGLVLPSLEENCPMSVLEAMAAGIPVVASRVGGIPELIEDGISGLLCDPNDATNLRQQLGRILKEPTFASGLATAARLRAEQRFRPEIIARRHLEIYRELLRSES